MAQRWFYLESGSTSLLVDAAPGAGAFPTLRHFGARIGAKTDFASLANAEPLPLWGARLDQPPAPSILPGLEAGYFGAPAVSPSSPGSWTFEGADADTTSKGARLKLMFRRREPGSGLLTQTFQAFGDSGVIGARLQIEGWDETIFWAAAMALPLPQTVTEAISFGGDWAREMAAHRASLGPGGLILESRRGRPGHDRFPGLILGEPDLTDDRGAAYGVTLGWSGNIRLRVDPQRTGGWIVQAGELTLDGDEAFEAYDSPWAYAAYSDKGLNGLAACFQKFVRTRIIPPIGATRPRPVHYNTWEAVYFVHELPVLKELAERAAYVGAERFVLDDGWFKGRDSDRTGLGDWSPDPAKYPDGLFPLIEHVRSLGLEFGLWIEPEMVNPESALARANPAWLRREADGSLLLQRNQAVLDIAQDRVSDYLFRTISELLSAYPIAYLKWDMNRDLTGLDAQGRPGHADYVRALYDLIERIRGQHPAVEIEGCASGGGRIDYGLLSLTDRVWTSDSNDALDRLDIQRNALLFLPPEVTGAHVGPAACHITGRRLSLDLRAHVALFGHMGLELDLRSLSQADADRLKQHIANYVRFRPLIHTGILQRLSFTDPDHTGVYAAGANGDGLALIVRTGSARLGQGTVVRLPMLDRGTLYRVEAVPPVSPSAQGCLSTAILKGGVRVPGQWLAQRGMELFLPRPETSVLFSVKRDG